MKVSVFPLYILIFMLYSHYSLYFVIASGGQMDLPADIVLPVKGVQPLCQSSVFLTARKQMQFCFVGSFQVQCSCAVLWNKIWKHRLSLVTRFTLNWVKTIPGTGRKRFSDCDKVLQRKYLKAGGIS